MIGILLIIVAAAGALFNMFYAIFGLLSNRPIPKYSEFITLSMFGLGILGFAIGVPEAQEMRREKEKKTYSAWAKHTGNPGNLTLPEYLSLNDNYVPRGKHERRTKQPELE